MQSEKSELIRLELKYCERCGGLWLRPKDSDVVFCGPCTKGMAGLISLAHYDLRKTQATVQASSVETFWGEGGNA
jgi:hypothetical protein